MYEIKSGQKKSTKSGLGSPSLIPALKWQGGLRGENLQPQARLLEMRTSYLPALCRWGEFWGPSGN